MGERIKDLRKVKCQAPFLDLWMTICYRLGNLWGNNKTTAEVERPWIRRLIVGHDRSSGVMRDVSRMSNLNNTSMFTIYQSC
jgi:hypothetical protein